MKGAINPNSTLYIQAGVRGYEEAADTRRLTAPEIFPWWFPAACPGLLTKAGWCRKSSAI